MVVLPNYPNVDQKKTGRNGLNNCVPTSIADGLEYLTGKQIDVAAMVASVYGPNYTGFTSASMFIGFCAQYGVRLWPIDSPQNSTLVADVHAHIKQLHPVIATEPDVWAADHPEWSHVLSFYREEEGYLTARDPYGVFDVTHPDSEWAKLFEFHEIWVLEEENEMAITIESPGVKNYFHEVASDRWHCIQTQHDIAYAVLAHYKATNGLLTLGLPISEEIPIEQVHPTFAKYAGHKITVQWFEGGARIYDPAHLVDAPPGAGEVYRAHLYSPDAPGTDPRLYALQNQLVVAKAAQGSADPAAAQKLATDEALLAKMKALLA